MRIVFFLALVSLAIACSSQPASGPRETPSRSTSPSQAAPAAPKSGPHFDPDAIDVGLEPLASGFEAPLLVTNAGDGSGRIFVVEQGGRVWTVRGGVVSNNPWLDIASRITAGGEQGLLGLAFHPEFATNGRFFVDYTDIEGDTVVAEYTVEPNGTAVDPETERVLLHIDQPFANHNGGAIAFGPDGDLYVAMGDGGGAGDPEENGQDLGALLGKLLRIDVDTRSGGLEYGIPSDNPFVDRAGARPEIWAYGLRNPWRFSFDPPSRRIWIGDVGQTRIEEVDVAPVGKGGINYGWNAMEGSTCFSPSECKPLGHLPVTEYGHDEGCVVVGGFVYRGTKNPDLAGGYYFGDYCSGKLWAIPSDSSEKQTPINLLESDHSFSSFGLDEDGEMYATDIASGEVLHLVDR